MEHGLHGNLQLGAIVRTTYGTGPYRIADIHGPCSCSSYLDSINMSNPPASEPHFHLVCEWAGHVSGHKHGKYYLNGYRHDGSNVWNDDRLIFEGIAGGTQFDLFDGGACA